MEAWEKTIIGCSDQLRKIKEMIRQVAGSDLNILLCGESGVGKELVAKALHHSSNRKDKPFIKVNCAAIPTELLESELFGYERGAFTGADRRKEGKFELAHRGSILLDEIGDMPLQLQSKLLQVLQDSRFSRLGGHRDIKVDCWIMAATNQDLEKNIATRMFREDLYYRLNIIRIVLPPLRERPEDIKSLTEYFAKKYSVSDSNPGLFTEEVYDFFERYPWPGNVRELKNTVKRLLILRDWLTIKDEMRSKGLRPLIDIRETKACSYPEVGDPQSEEIAGANEDQILPLRKIKKKALCEVERRIIDETLRRTGWNRRRAAKILQISYKTMLYKIKELNLEPSEKNILP
jgi:two-component system response regulator AtoC